MMKMMKQKSNQEKRLLRILTAALILSMTIWLMPTNTEAATETTYPSNPRVSGGFPRVSVAGCAATWDCIYFGHYPQTSDGNGGFNNDKIKWRVLSVNGSDAYLLADKILDLKEYNTKFGYDITWETSTVRSWLNGYGSSANKCGEDHSSDNFIDKAFTPAEQASIKDTKVVNGANMVYSSYGGNDTTDKVFFLSQKEARDGHGYGFMGNWNDDLVQRKAQSTDYAKCGNDRWWLRTPGVWNNLKYHSKSCAAVYITRGMIAYEGFLINFENGVRPVLHLDLDLDPNVWENAGTVEAITEPNPLLREAYYKGAK